MRPSMCEMTVRVVAVLPPPLPMQGLLLRHLPNPTPQAGRAFLTRIEPSSLHLCPAARGASYASSRRASSSWAGSRLLWVTLRQLPFARKRHFLCVRTFSCTHLLLSAALSTEGLGAPLIRRWRTQPSRLSAPWTPMRSFQSLRPRLPLALGSAPPRCALQGLW